MNEWYGTGWLSTFLRVSLIRSHIEYHTRYQTQYHTKPIKHVSTITYKLF